MSRARLIRGAAALVAITAALVVAGCGGGVERIGRRIAGRGPRGTGPVLDPRAGRHLPPRPDGLRLHRRLRSLGRVPRHGVGHLQQPDAAHAGELPVHGRTARQRARARPGHRDPGADRRRAGLHLHPEEGRLVRTAGQPADHVHGHRVRLRAHRDPLGRGAVRLLLLADRGLRRVRRRQGEDDLRHRDPERHHDPVHADRAGRGLHLPARHARHGSDPARGGRLPRGRRRVRALRHRLGSLHAPGQRQARHLELRARRSRSRASTPPPGCRW